MFLFGQKPPALFLKAWIWLEFLPELWADQRIPLGIVVFNLEIPPPRRVFRAIFGLRYAQCTGYAEKA